jgi:hypothetical protein
MSVIAALEELSQKAGEASEYASRCPGHVERNGAVIADIYRAIGELAALVARGMQP